MKFIQVESSRDFQTFKCESSGSNPKSYIEISGNIPDMQIGTSRTSKKFTGLKTSRTVKIPVTQKIHNSEISCTETWYGPEAPFFRQMRNHVIKVDHAPASVSISFNDNRSSVIEGMNEIKCHVIGGYPAAKSTDVEIFIDGKSQKGLIRDPEKNIISTGVQIDKTFHKKSVSCRVNHPQLENPLSVEKTLEVKFQPESLKLQLERKNFEIGEKITIKAIAAASYPPSSVTCKKILFDGTETELKKGNETLSQAVPYGTVTTKFLYWTIEKFEDDAEITCFVDGYPEISASEKISVLTAAEFLIGKKFSVKEGEKFRLDSSMIIRANPAVTDIRWEKSGRNSKSLKTEVSNDRTFFVIPRVKTDTGGEYFVEAEGLSGTFEIEVLTPPKIFFTGEKKLLLGQDLKLTCESTGFPEPVITWKKDGEPVSTSNNLLIQKIQKSHAGIYSCEAENDHSKTVEELSVEVSFEPIIKPVNDRLIFYEEDKELTLDCLVDSYPRAENVFFISPNEMKIAAEWDGERWTHLINRQTSEINFGKWSCMASNYIGTSKADFFVIQAGRPGKISGLKLENLTENSVMLKWTKGAENGYEQKFRISVTKATSSGQNEAPFFRTATFSDSIRLENLTDPNGYIATVIAENEKGMAPPTQISFNLVSSQSQAAIPTIYIYLISFTILTLAIIATIIFCNRRREFIYQAKSKS